MVVTLRNGNLPGVTVKPAPRLKWFSAENFRAFRTLNIQQLGQVNLVVGKNNVGKTCLLEALWLYANFVSPEVIRHILTARYELTTRAAEESQLSAIKHLFYGRQLPADVQENLIQLWSPARKLNLRTGRIDRGVIEQVEQAVLSPDKNKIEELTRQLVSGEINPDTSKLLQALSGQPVRRSGEAELVLGVEAGKSARLINDALKQVVASVVEEWPVQFVASGGLSNAQMVELWDQVYLTDLQDEVEAALRPIEPDLKNVGLVSSLEGIQIPQARMSSGRERVLLSSLGEGMNRLFGLALALVNAQNGFLLVDEIGSGIHYSGQLRLWDFIFTQAQRLNVQVFATTHSWDAVEAFQQAAQAHTQVEGMLISLRRKEDSPGEVIGTLFNETDLAYVTREQIEVR